LSYLSPLLSSRGRTCSFQWRTQLGQTFNEKIRMLPPSDTRKFYSPCSVEDEAHLLPPTFMRYSRAGAPAFDGSREIIQQSASTRQFQLSH
jgi:hypothetical protein